MDPTQRLNFMIFAALTDGLGQVGVAVPVDKRMLLAEQIGAELCQAGVSVPPVVTKARDLGPQTFGPAPGPDGDTTHWDDQQ